MTSRWYCVDCEREIDADAIDEHEDDGHTVRGTIRPDRLLRNDPWNMGVEGDGAARADADDDTVPPTDAGRSTPSHDAGEPTSRSDTRGDPEP